MGFPNHAQPQPVQPNEFQGPVLQVKFHSKPGVRPEPSDNLYIKGLHISTTAEDIAGIFGKCGSIVSMKTLPGQQDMCALVRMGSVMEAQQAIAEYDGLSSVLLHLAKYMPELEVRYHGAKGAPPSDNLYVKGLSLQTGADDVRSLFSPFGTIQQQRIMPPNGSKDLTALVRLSSVDNGVEPRDSQQRCKVRLSEHRLLFSHIVLFVVASLLGMS
eukprot:4266571-Amphidinium_carterae.1